MAETRIEVRNREFAEEPEPKALITKIVTQAYVLNNTGQWIEIEAYSEIAYEQKHKIIKD